jgi:hypothetical protein
MRAGVVCFIGACCVAQRQAARFAPRFPLCLKVTLSGCKVADNFSS